MQLASLLSYLLIIILSTLLGFFIGYKWFERQQLKAEEDEDSDNDSSDEEYDEEESDDEEDENPDYSMKMVLCVRKDLPMTKGKVCAQCCHAAVGAVSHARRYTKEIYKHWKRSGCKKVALSCPDEEIYWKIEKEAKKAGLTYYTVCDAGRTQLDPHTFTVIALGPDREERIDKITGRDGIHPLKLL